MSLWSGAVTAKVPNVDGGKASSDIYRKFASVVPGLISNAMTQFPLGV